MPAPTHYPSSFFNSQYLGGGTIRLTSWRMATVPQNTPPYGLNYYFNNGISSANVKTTGGAIYSFFATNNNASARFFQFFNSNAAPIVNALPSFAYTLPPGSVNTPTEIILGTDFFGPNGIAFTNGISFGFSTSLTVFIPTPTPNDHVVQVNYT